MSEIVEASRPTPLVICGPSGVGKGTLIKMLMDEFPQSFGFSVSNTTRNPRDGEVDGVHYNFMTKEQFQEGVEKNKFIEYANVHTNMYGTTFEGVDRVRNKGKICILDIDVQGVRNVKRSELVCKYIFVSPPGMEQLESRLRSRNTETEEKIQIRLRNAVDELAYGNEEGAFDSVIVNEDLNVAYAELVATLKAWYPEQLVA